MASAAAAFIAGNAASPFPEGFESGTLEGSGWTATNADEAKFSWTVTKYADEAAQFPKNIPVPENGGIYCLKSATGGHGFNITGKIAPDNRIVSPVFAIEDGSTWLSFMLSNNMACNITPLVTGDDTLKSRFEIYVSPTGSTDTEAFTDTIYSSIPMGLNKWQSVNIDLSKYKGKQIRLAIRNYQQAPIKNFVANTLYIDNLHLVGSAVSDIAVISTDGFISGTIKEQKPTVTFVNYGAPASMITLRAQASTTNATGEIVEEVLNRTVNTGDTIVHTFQSPCILPAAGDNTITISAESEGELNTVNNTLQAGVYLYPAAPLPFTLASGEAASLQMISTASGTIRQPDGWMYFQNFESWIYTNYQKTAFLYPAQSFPLTEGIIKVSFDGNLTTGDAKFQVYLSDRDSEFTELAGETAIKTGDNSGYLFINVKEPAEKLLAIKIAGADQNSQFRLTSLQIEKTDQVPDVAVKRIYPIDPVVAGDARKISVDVTNEGAAAATEVAVTLKDDNGHELSGTIPSIDAGATATIEFPTELTFKAGTHKLTANANATGDFNIFNNLLTAQIVAYDPKSTPWRDSFEDDNENALWTIINENNDNSKWIVNNQYQFDGEHLLALPVTFASNHDDWAITPAITLPAGYKGRLSFYYGSGGNAGTAHVKAYLTKSTDPSDIKENGRLLIDKAAGSVSVDYASVLVDITEAGRYHIAFLADEGKQSLLIDDVRLDQTEEIAVTGAALSTELKAAYDLESSSVTIKGHNFGRNAMNGCKVGYAAYISTNGKNEQVAYVEENASLTAAPGADFEYTFNKKLDFTREGIYTIAVAVIAENDADSKNNSFQTLGPEKLPTMQIPALWDMEFSDHLHGYIFDKPGQKWGIAGINPYAGIYSLSHGGRCYNQSEGDLVVLNRVCIPAGTYQFSFFWRTTQGQTDEKYQQTFDFLLGSSPDIKDLDKTIFSVVNGTAHEKKARKEMTEFTVDKDGYYFLGIHLKKAGTEGNLAIDNVKIEKPEALATIDANNKIYEADFANRESEWQHYHPLRMQAQQWNLQSDDKGSYLEALEFQANEIDYTTSWLQAPALLLKAGNIYKITLDTELLPLDETTPLKDGASIAVYDAACDLPSEFKEIGRCKTGAQKTEIDVIPETDGLHYFSILPDCGSSATVRLRGFKAEYRGNVAANMIDADSKWDIDGNILTVSDGVRVYTTDGHLVNADSNRRIELLPSTVYILIDASGSHKIMAK